MTDENRRNAARLDASRFHPLERLTAGNAGVNKNARSRAFNDSGIPAAAAGQHRDTDSHARQHTFSCCGNGSNYWVKLLPSGDFADFANSAVSLFNRNGRKGRKGKRLFRLFVLENGACYNCPTPETQMSRILLVHWNESEAAERARNIAKHGHKVFTLWNSEKPRLGEIRSSPPDLFVIDLSRLPSQGRELAGYFRRIKSTRQIPILFIDGDSERVKRARNLIPDAEFATSADMKTAIRRAIRQAPANPVVPATMAGYSGTPLPKKLGIRENYLVVLVNAPERFERKLDPLAKGAEIISDASSANVAVLFANSEAELARDFRALAKALPEKAALWMAWPKKASGVKTDLTENIVREFGLGLGWVDYKICAIDETWSGLCFARKKDR
jgi:CheY-like chemotaxis protein